MKPSIIISKVKKFWRRAMMLGIAIALSLGLLPVGIEFRQKMNTLISPIADKIQANKILLTPTPTPQPEITIQRILGWSRNTYSSRATELPQNEVAQIILTGDIMLGRSVNFNMHRKNNFAYPVEKVADKLKQADITVANLEAPLIDECNVTGEGMRFCSDFQSLYTLHFAGIDIVQLANNHITDHGQAGLEETRKWVNFQGLEDIGLGQAAIQDVRGTKFGFLAYNQVPPIAKSVETADGAKLKQDIAELKLEADVVMVGFHWGQEYQDHPNQEQLTLAHAAIDAGADVVFGHHPHWVQGVEIYKGKPIFYSLGNFVFDQMWSQPTREGIVVELNFHKDKLIEAKVLPVFMTDFAQPEWQPVGAASPTLKKIEKLSEELTLN